MPIRFERPDVAEIREQLLERAKRQHPGAKYFAFIIDWNDKAGTFRAGVVPCSGEPTVDVVPVEKPS
jgi:sorbitol-specific phosphotransferase system component IIBC